MSENSGYDSDSDEDIQIRNERNLLTRDSNENQFKPPVTVPVTDADASSVGAHASSVGADASSVGADANNEQIIGDYKVTKETGLIQRINNDTDAYRVQKGENEYFVFKGPINAMTGGQKKSKSQKRGGKKQRQTKRKMGGRRRSNRKR